MPEAARIEYPPTLVELLRELPLAPLGPGRPQPAFRARLEALSDPALGTLSADRGMAAACRAGLWLAFDFLDESHAISQELPTAEGSFWHGILHRREPDAANAKYWFRRVGDHPVYPALSQAAREVGLVLRTGRWDPFAFIDLCEEHRDTGGKDELLLRQVQRKEWELLFGWCWRRAAGGG